MNKYIIWLKTTAIFQLITAAMHAILLFVMLLTNNGEKPITAKGGLMNWYLLRKKVEAGIKQGVITINLFVFGILFGLATRFTLMQPIIMTGLIVLFLITAGLTIRKNS